jgi:hypothetical protein
LVRSTDSVTPSDYIILIEYEVNAEPIVSGAVQLITTFVPLTAVVGVAT